MQRLLLVPALLTLFIASAKAESTCNKYGVCKTNDTYDPDLYNEDEAKKQLELPESSSEQKGNHDYCLLRPVLGVRGRRNPENLPWT
ncbi:hypothetical protein PMIT1342_00036 [Prochlorococcus marinus str. MIT 1342]|uniref:hypothetical protein n=1 Tax=Prochlorococcus TaxID=1218 RepID=UPI0007BC2CFE|nr:hypothetical protein [Prochlorococcus marinus]KZR84463.1 hypothetical protein PMIT1342_00036 [Prochlorococcus marinus str. MIT 1342]